MSDSWYASRGFTALVVTLILSILLLTLAVACSSTVFFLRATIADREGAQASLALAESCANAALLRMRMTYGYQPSARDSQLALGGVSCTIDSIIYTTEDAHYQRTATITTHASAQHSYAVVIVRALVHNPAKPLASNFHYFSILSWTEAR